MSIHTDSKDIFERIAATIKNTIRPLSPTEIVEDQFMYYRA